MKSLPTDSLLKRRLAALARRVSCLAAAGPAETCGSHHPSRLRRVRWEHVFTVQTIRKLPNYPSAALHALVNPIPTRATNLSGPINQDGFDIVTIVFSEELDLLALQARSFAKFMSTDFKGNFLIIVNDLRCAQVMRKIERWIVPQYGQWQKRVRVVPFHRLARRLDPSNGWIIQQALKLASAQLIDRSFYVVFDAKNHLIAPVTSSHFFDEEGAARQSFQVKPTLMAEHHATGVKYFDLEDGENVVQFVPMTPFTLHTQTTRDLIKYIETREKVTLSDFFCDTRCLSEFLLYGCFLAWTPALMRHYVDTKSQAVTLWEAEGTIESAISSAQDPEVFCFAIHREILKRAGKAHMAQLARFWRERGLMRSDETFAGLASFGGRAGIRDRWLGKLLATLLLATFGAMAAMMISQLHLPKAALFDLTGLESREHAGVIAGDVPAAGGVKRIRASDPLDRFMDR